MMSGVNKTIFIHGAGGSSKHWHSLIKCMSGTISPVLYELPGHGLRTDIIPSTMESLLSDFESYIAQSSIDNFNLVGHSLGGLLALLYVLKCPDKVNKLILISSAANILIHPDFLEQIKSGNFNLPFLESGLAASMSNELKQLVINDLKQIKLPQDAEDFMGVSTCNVKEQVSKILNKTLIIVGQQDKVVSPRRSKELSQLITNSVLAIIPTAKHYPHLEEINTTSNYIYDFIVEKS